MRKSPTESATQFAPNTKRKGNDGNLWIVKLDKNEVHRWALDTQTEENLTKKTSPRSPSRYYTIRYGEASTNLWGGTFEVNNRMFRKLFETPQILKNSEGYDAGYLFGKRYAKHKYEEIGSHGNDVAQTSMILEVCDESALQKLKLKKKAFSLKNGLPDVAVGVTIDRISKKHKYRWNWNHPEFIQELRSAEPRLVWIGETFGGDVGASYWVHRKTDGDIDSVIVSVSYFEEDMHDSDL